MNIKKRRHNITGKEWNKEDSRKGDRKKEGEELKKKREVLGVRKSSVKKKDVEVNKWKMRKGEKEEEIRMWK